ncbi:MAG: PCRF domain-containing protein, partial [Planctomycetales bacterium]|nr:PCRF domain-containing protein [Planctomycetales bacterium]
MDAELVQRSEKIKKRLKLLAESLNYSGKSDQIKRIEAKMAEQGFWDNNESAQKTVGELKALKVIVGPMNELSSSVDDLSVLMEMAEEDESIAGDVAVELERLEGILDDLELKALLSGPNDSAGAILTINARDGGTDANDWAEMLLR